MLAESWANLQEALRLRPDDPPAQSTYLGSLLYDPDADPAWVLAPRTPRNG
jgi:hypothetical protein